MVSNKPISKQIKMKNRIVSFADIFLIADCRLRIAAPQFSYQQILKLNFRLSEKKFQLNPQSAIPILQSAQAFLAACNSLILSPTLR